MARSVADAFADDAREAMARVVISKRRESVLRAGSLRRSVTLPPSHGRTSVKHAENHTRHVAVSQNLGKRMKMFTEAIGVTLES